MMDEKILKKQLIKKGRLSKADLLKAEDYSLTAKIPLDEALIFLDMIDFHDLGETLSEIYRIPYQPLLDRPPSSKAKSLVPPELIEKWHIFPVAFDPVQGSLMLAISNPGDHEKLFILEGNLFARYHLSYTVASDMEIKRAFERYYLGKKVTEATQKDLKLPEDFTILPDEMGLESLEVPKEPVSHAKRILLLDPELSRARALRTLFELEGIEGVTWVSTLKDAKRLVAKGAVDALLVNENIFAREGGWLEEIEELNSSFEITYYQNFSPLLLQQAYPYDQMSTTLISTVDLLVTRLLRDHPKSLADIRLCAKYGKLLAMRLGLSGAKVDAIVLSAWLSIPELRRSLLETIKSPYPLREIMEYEKFLKKGERPMEITTYGMVRSYIEALADHPEIRGDLGAVRDVLMKKFPFPEDEPTIESFLQLLREDQLLQDVGKASGRILIIDPEVCEDSGFYLRLSNDGYQLNVVDSPEEALRFLSNAVVDVIISDINRNEEDGLDFCRKVKTNPSFRDILFIVLTGDTTPGLAAKSIGAGADDFLQKPVDLELLSLKLSRALAKIGRGKVQRGVSGSLNDMSLTDLVQILSAGDKDVIITLEGSTRKGEIFIRQGEVIHCTTGDASGEEAFYKLMGWKDVNFSVIPCHEFPDRTINMSLMSLLMEGARLMDEAAAEKAKEPLE